MNIERLEKLNALSERIRGLENELQAMAKRCGARSELSYFYCSLASEDAWLRALKVIEQDLEAQLAQAKREFEVA